MIKKIYNELKHHAPFTILGAISGIILMILFQRLPNKIAHNVFYILHPMHVILSAIVTSSIYSLHKYGNLKGRINLFMLLIIGYLGSVGIATLSDSIIPYIAEALLDMPHRHHHIGFIEKWWLINPLAIAGITIAYFKPSTKFPHAGHVLVSTWASLFHIIMAKDGQITTWSYVTVFLFLFIAVWVPCCISDIAFPLFFVNKKV